MGRVPGRAFGLIIVVCAVYWWAVFAAMHVLEPEFNPIRAPGSAYVLGEYGGWMTTTYFALAVCLISAGLGLATRLSATAMRRIAVGAFLVAACGTVLAGLFPMDYPLPPRTSSGRWHALGGALTFPSWVVGTFLFSLSGRRDRQDRRRAAILLALSAASVGMAVVMILSLVFLGFAGYAQRLLIVLLHAWLIVVALDLIRSVN